MDIKPTNIAIDAEGNFILIDLGSVAEINAMTEVTDLYLPLEERAVYGRYRATERRDWLMLAITIFSKIEPAWDGMQRIHFRELEIFLNQPLLSSLKDEIFRAPP